MRENREIRRVKEEYGLIFDGSPIVGKDSQMGSHIVEALWALNTCLGAIESELVTSQETALESMWLLRCSLIYNMRWIEMTLAVQRERS